MIPLSIDKVREIQEINRRGEKIDRLEDTRFAVTPSVEPQLLNVVGEESITRFDRKRPENGGGGSRRAGGGNGGNSGGGDRKNRGGSGRNNRNGGANNRSANQGGGAGAKSGRGEQHKKE